MRIYYGEDKNAKKRRDVLFLVNRWWKKKQVLQIGTAMQATTIHVSGDLQTIPLRIYPHRALM